MLRLASYNVQSGRGARGGHDPAALARSIAALDADIVALQEIDHLQPRSGNRDQLADVVAALAAGGQPWAGHFLPTIIGTPSLTRTWRPARGIQVQPGTPAYGIALMTRLPVQEWHALRLEPFWGRLPMLVPTPRGRMVPMLVPDEPRAALGAVVRTELGPMTVIGTHLSFLPVRAVRQLRRVVDWAGARPGPRLLLGDLNLPGPLPPTVSRWRRLADERTFPAHDPRTQLDHALADDLERTVPVRTRTVRGEVSDHLALVLDLSPRR